MNQMPDQNTNMTDDDSISITSTAPSEPREEYAVETVLAARETDGVTQYLVKWEGYPEERCTWEPATSFQSLDTLSDWNEKKLRIEQGLEVPCDVDDLLKRIDIWIKSSQDRKSRRRAKRIRLGLPVASDDTDDEASFNSQGSSHDEDPEDLRISTENDDKNRQVETSAPVEDRRQQWSHEEEEALVKGLGLANGPHYDQILSHFGSTGIINQSLKNRTTRDLQIKAQELRDEYEEMDIAIPHYLQSVSEMSTNVKSPYFHSGHPKPSLASTPGSTFNRGSNSLQNNRRRATNEEFTRHRPNHSHAAAGFQQRMASDRQKVCPTGSTRDTYRGRQSQMGSSGRGPARLHFNNASANFYSKKPAVLGANVFKNWNKDITGDKPTRPSSRKYVKVMRRGVQAPDINKLILVDPTRSKKPFYPNLPPTKTPFELIQSALRDDADDSFADGSIPSDKSTPVTADTMKIPADNPSAPNSLEAVAEITPKATDSNIPEAMLGNSAVAQDLDILKDGEEATFMEGANPGQGSTGPDVMEETTLGALNPTNPEFGAGSGEIAAQKKTKIAISEWREKFLVPKPPGAPEVPGIKRLETTQDVSSVTVTAKALEALMETPESNTGDANSAESATRALRFDDVRTQPQNFSFEAPVAHAGISGAGGSPVTSTSARDLEAEIQTPVMMEENNNYDNSQPPRLRSKFNSALNPAKLSRPGVNGVLLIGQHREEIGLVKMIGLGTTARNYFTNIQEGPKRLTICFQEMCGAVNYRAFCHSAPFDYYGAGYLLPYNHTMDRLRQWALTLRLNASGAIFNCLYFSLLVYPIEGAAESWDFLNNVLELQQGEMYEQGVVLRVVMRKPLPVYDPMVDMNIQGNQISIREGEGAYSMVLRNLLDIDYLRLIKHTISRDTASGNNFFLLFPETAKREEYIIYKFLEENHANVYSWQTDGAWDYFVTYILSGSILIESSFYELYNIPNLLRVLKRPITFFNLSFHPDPFAPHPHINPIFPHGAAILITDSLLLLQPYAAARILKWFQLFVLVNKASGTWKLCTRPLFRHFLLSLINDRNIADGKVYMEMSQSIDQILPEQLDPLINKEYNDEGASTIRCMSDAVSFFDQTVGKGSQTNLAMPEAGIANNDAIMVEWFAGWAMTQLENFRKFHIIMAPCGGGPGARGGGGSGPVGAFERQRKEWMRKWSHITILTPEEALNLHKIPDAEAKWKADEDMLKGKREKEKEKAKVTSASASASASAAGSGSGSGSTATASVEAQGKRKEAVRM